MKQMGDFIKLRREKTGLSFEEYITFELYNNDTSEFENYIGDDRARSALLLANKLTSWDAAEDKLFFNTLINAAELPSPKIHAVIHLSLIHI